jgi:hypothetical protein
MRVPLWLRTLADVRALITRVGGGLGPALVLAATSTWAPASLAQEVIKPLPWNWSSQCRPQTGPAATVRQGNGWVQQRPVAVCVLLPPGGIDNGFQSIGAGKVQVGFLLGRLDRQSMGIGPSTRWEVLSQLAFDCGTGSLMRRDLGSRSLAANGAVVSENPGSGPWQSAGPAPEAALARSLRAKCSDTVR